jgi:hypothetical protein
MIFNDLQYIRNALIMEIDSSDASVNWINAITLAGYDLQPYAITESNGLYIVTGTCTDNDDNVDVVLWAFKSDGSLSWTNYLPYENYTTGSQDPISATTLADGGVVFITDGQDFKNSIQNNLYYNKMLEIVVKILWP